ncbi:GH36 C-terminal domain-containing protein [Tunturiibacter gelidiferens]|uniref:GH36 C-terminal domain-containing protein n=1 Tax=Tunturiibacter gelidiferens TaxID=3069689 RepID=UPI00334287D3
MQYVAQDGSKAVLFAYLHSQHYGIDQPLIRLRGLDVTADYRISPWTRTHAREVVSGAVMMGRGAELQLLVTTTAPPMC